MPQVQRKAKSRSKQRHGLVAKEPPPFVRKPVKLPYKPTHVTIEAIRAAVEKLAA